MHQPHNLRGMTHEVRGKLRRNRKIDRTPKRLADVDEAPRRRVRHELVAWLVPERNRHDVGVVPPLAQRAGELADEDLGAAVDERRLRFQDQDSSNTHVAWRKLMISPSSTMYSLPSSRTSPCSLQACIEPRDVSAS